jgi:hypothetical protein
MGAAFLVARSGQRVIDVGADSMRLLTATGSELRLFRTEDNHDGAVRGWQMCRT